VGGIPTRPRHGDKEGFVSMTSVAESPNTQAQSNDSRQRRLVGKYGGSDRCCRADTRQGRQMVLAIRTCAIVLCFMLPIDCVAWTIQLKAAGVESRVGRLSAYWWERTSSRIASGTIGHIGIAPVHEEITHRAFGCAAPVEDVSCGHPLPGAQHAPDATIVGVQWNDNPPFRLENAHAIPGCEPSVVRLPALQPSCWLIVFDAARKAAATRPDGRPGRRFDGKGRDAMMVRSHLGDLQFLHSMASRNAEPAIETRTWILRWLQFGWKAAAGDDAFKPSDYLYKVPIEGFEQLFDLQRGWSIVGFFMQGDPTYRREDAFREFVLGTVLHTIEDSFAAGHVERADPSGEECDLGNGERMVRPGRIVSFHSYLDQDSSLHSEMDSRRALSRHLLTASPNVVDVSRALVDLFRKQVKWSVAERYFECVYTLIDDAQPSGPGRDFSRSSMH